METIYHGAGSQVVIEQKNLVVHMKHMKVHLYLKVNIKHLWNVQPRYCNWDDLKEKIKTYGIHNSLVTALMPTASTSQIMGNTECFEWFTNNIYTRRTLAGDFILVNKHLINDLVSIGEWNKNKTNYNC